MAKGWYMAALLVVAVAAANEWCMAVLLVKGVAPA
jgi:hypothetical protein